MCAAFDSSAPLPQEVLDAGESIGIDVRAIRQKYATQKIVSNLGTDEDAIKTKAMIEDAERMRQLEAMSEGKPVEIAQKTSSQSKRLDRLVVCQRCLGQGLVKTEYNYQIRETNCDECDAEGILFKSDDGRLVKMKDSGAEAVVQKPMSDADARALANGGSKNSFSASIDDTLKANFGPDGKPVKISMANHVDDDPPPVMC